jgi:hypothetical protein
VPAAFAGAIGKRTVALELAALGAKRLEPRGQSALMLRHVLRRPSARCGKLTGFIPRLVPLKGLTLPFHRGLMFPELLLTRCEPPA